jgi:hypothetical protein
MGTRADFYVGRDTPEWLGSIAWDGCPQGIVGAIIYAVNEQAYRIAVKEFLAGREDGTTPDQGWPWPWDNSHATDYAYAFDGGQVWACSARFWFPATAPEPEENTGLARAVFPDMSHLQNVAWGGRSGLLVIG